MLLLLLSVNRISILIIVNICSVSHYTLTIYNPLNVITKLCIALILKENDSKLQNQLSKITHNLKNASSKRAKAGPLQNIYEIGN